MLPTSLFLQAAEQLERASSASSSPPLIPTTTTLSTNNFTEHPHLSPPPDFYIPHTSEDYEEQQQRIYDVAEIMARIGYGNQDNKVLSKKEQRQQLASSSSSATSGLANTAALLSLSNSGNSSFTSNYSLPLTPHQMLPISTNLTSLSALPSSTSSSSSTTSTTNNNSSSNSNSNLIMLTKRKKEIYMTRDDWEDSCIIAIECLKLNTKTEISLAHFALELETRCTVKNNGIRVFMIFPWFHMKNIRFRQSLKRDGRLGPTIEKVIDAVNYFVKRDGKDYTESELSFLLNYYKKMEVPEPSRCLTTIVEVYCEFKKFQDEIYRTNSQSEVIKILLDQSRMIEELGRQVESLRQEVINLKENGIDTPTAKRPRVGG